jgi:hypothetical protein
MGITRYVAEQSIPRVRAAPRGTGRACKVGYVCRSRFANNCPHNAMARVRYFKRNTHVGDALTLFQAGMTHIVQVGGSPWTSTSRLRLCGQSNGINACLNGGAYGDRYGNPCGGTYTSPLPFAVFGRCRFAVRCSPFCPPKEETPLSNVSPWGCASSGLFDDAARFMKFCKNGSMHPKKNFHRPVPVGKTRAWEGVPRPSLPVFNCRQHATFLSGHGESRRNCTCLCLQAICLRNTRRTSSLTESGARRPSDWAWRLLPRIAT